MGKPKKKRAAKIPKESIPEVFVAHADGTFTCEECSHELKIDLGDPKVEVWQYYSAGWLGPCVCRGCKLSIPVYVDGEESSAPV